MDRTVKREEEREGKRVFTLLKPLCTKLLDVSSASPEDRAVVLDALNRVLKEVPPAGLQRCMDYALFPLLLLLDAAVAGRSSNSAIKLQLSGKNQIMRVGDRIAEGVLSALEVILQKCVLETISQVTMLLQKITVAAMLSPAEAAEEFRHGVVKCLQALLHNLKPCDSTTCVCKLSSASPFVALAQTPLAFFSQYANKRIKLEEHIDTVNACPLGYLQAENMSAVIGHMISLLLQIAEAEVAAGAAGSGKLRRDALFTIRTLILKVGTADGVAYFLPGVASGLTKVMGSSRASKLRSPFPSAIVHTSGAAGWPAAVEESIRGITEMLVIVLGDDENAGVCSSANPVETGTSDKQEHVTATAALEALQGLSVQRRIAVKEQPLSGEITVFESNKVDVIRAREKEQTMTIMRMNQAAKGGASPPLRSPRTKEWLDLTTSRLSALLSQTFPLLCAHQSPPVRLAVAEAAAILLATCGCTLKSCTTLFLECLLALACDDWEYVASAAQTYLTLLLAPPVTPPRKAMEDIDGAQTHIPLRSSLVNILSSMLDQLPRVVFAADISMSVLHARRLAAAMYFSGPDGVSAHLLDTLVEKHKFIGTLSQCLSFNTTFTGSLEQIMSSKPTLYGPIVSEVKSRGQGDDSDRPQHTETAPRLVEEGIEAEELPTMPPWLSLGSGSKLYHVLADVLRLAGLSAVTDQSRGTTLVSLVELLLVNVRQAAVIIGLSVNETASEETIANGQEQRMAATSVCVLNEIIYGASGAWNDKLFLAFGDHMLHKNLQNEMAKSVWSSNGQFTTTQQENSSQERQFERPDEFSCMQSLQKRWQAAEKDEVRKIISECAGNMLHDYLAKEVWDQPTDLASASFAKEAAVDNLPPVHTFQDNVMLQKVLVEGVGVLGIALDKAFEEGGFLGLVLFPLLEKLACPNYIVRCAAAVSLNTLCSHCQYTSVRDLVVANVDVVIDSLCRQFRHLPMYPNAPNLLAAILQHTNASADLLPLLEEPLRGVVLELDILARRNHPHFTVPLLRALREITRATRVEAGVILSKAADACLSCKTLLEKESDRKKEGVREDTELGARVSFSTEPGEFSVDVDLEELVNQFIDRRRCRRAVAAIAASCLVSCGPLLASKDPQPCLLALDTVEAGITTLSQAEEAAVHESKEKEYIQQLCSVSGFVQASDSLTSGINNEETEAKKLLPSMNRVWPHLVLCLRHAHTPVIIHTVAVIASATIECGGDFFIRRFQKDAVPILLRLLREGPTRLQRKKPKSPGLLMPHSNGHSQESAPGAVLKVQEAVLEGITAIAARKKSASALAGSFDLVAASVVVTACYVEALREVAANAVLALSKIDPDLVWILVMDVVYGFPKQEFKGSIPTGFPSFHKVFPPCKSPQEFLCIQYSAYEGDLTTLHTDAAQTLLNRLAITDAY